MKNKKILIIGIITVVILLLLVGLGFKLLGKGNSPLTKPNNSTIKSNRK